MHEEANAARKLTPEQRAEKKKRKMLENTSYGVSVSVYRVREVNDPSVKFKIEANANQLHMTGVVVLCKYLNVIVVEGGPKQQRKFKRLMINRIKWSEVKGRKHNKNAVEDEEDIEARKEKNSCKLVWEGSVKQRCFSNIIFKSCPTVAFAREYFKKYGVEHYWDIAQSDAIIETSDN
jgi:U4/U6 small nuclear ribonucleoprotein PRP3